MRQNPYAYDDNLVRKCLNNKVRESDFLEVYKNLSSINPIHLSESKANNLALEISESSIFDRYLENISKAFHIQKLELLNHYDRIRNYGIDIDSYLKNYAEKNSHGHDLYEANLIFGYTTDIWQPGLCKTSVIDPNINAYGLKIAMDLRNALNKIGSSQGTFYRGIGSVGDNFHDKYSVGSTVYEFHFMSCSKELSPNYPNDVVIEINTTKAKNISELSMDVNFAEQIGWHKADSEYVIPAFNSFVVTHNSGNKIIISDEDDQDIFPDPFSDAFKHMYQ